MSIRLSKVPAKRTCTGLFDQIISEEELQQIMSAAPKTFEVISDSGAPWTKADVSAVTRRRLWTIRTAAVLHALVALTVLLALSRMSNTDVQAAAAYIWALCAVLLTIGTFTSDNEGAE